VTRDPRWLAVPSPFAAPLLALALGWLGLFVLGGIVRSLAEVLQGRLVALSDVIGFLGMVGFFGVPISATLTFLASLVAGRWVARVLLLGATALLLLLGIALELVSSTGETFGGAVIFSALVLGVPLAVVLLATALSGLLAVREVRAARASHRAARLEVLLAARGQLDADGLGEALRMRPDEALGFAERAIADRGLAALVDREAGTVLSEATYGRKGRALVSVLHGRGASSLAELSRELGIGEARVEALLAEAARDGRFVGFVDSHARRVTTAEAAALREGRACPQCGGALETAGRDLVACAYCQAKIFFGPEARPAGGER
jgi:DNA-directed RNA polymerase subunit RPC12/RpoP